MLSTRVPPLLLDFQMYTRESAPCTCTMALLRVAWAADMALDLTSSRWQHLPTADTLSAAFTQARASQLGGASLQYPRAVRRS